MPDDTTPIPCDAFCRTLRGTADEVYTRLLQVRFGQAKKSVEDWRFALNKCREEPAR